MNRRSDRTLGGIMLTPDDAKEALDRLLAHNPAPTDTVDRYAAALRDQIVAFGYDPADPIYLAGMMLGSIVSLALVSRSYVAADTMLALVHQTETLRRLVEGEIPVLSVDDMLNLPGSER